jgi:putative transposase
LATDALSASWTSAPQHAGLQAECPLTDAPAYWALGNTPFDRCIAYRALLDDSQPADRVIELERATQRGWAVGSLAFLERLRQHAARPVAPRPRGRPRKRPETPKTG